MTIQVDADKLIDDARSRLDSWVGEMIGIETELHQTTRGDSGLL